MYAIGEKKATREAYGAALAEFGADERIVVLDADLSPATKTGTFKFRFAELLQTTAAPNTPSRGGGQGGVMACNKNKEKA